MGTLRDPVGYISRISVQRHEHKSRYSEKIQKSPSAEMQGLNVEVVEITSGVHRAAFGGALHLL